MREVELTFPEGAAALEHILEVHFALFALYMRRSVRPPARRYLFLSKKNVLLSDFLGTLIHCYA